jgi:hypothetical protein
MSHVTINLLVESESLNEAVRQVNNCLENENSFFDYFDIIEKDYGALETKRHILSSILEEENYLKKAVKFAREEDKQRRKKCYSSAGDYYRRAGELFNQCLSDDMAYYNLTEWSYYIPPDNKGWYFIPVDFHC